MDKTYILIKLSYFEILLVTLVLLYAFLFYEKKYFTKMIVSVINRLLLFLRGNVKNKKVIKTDDKSNTEETNG